MIRSTLSSIPKVSVVMPVFNGERYLAQSIASILSQTYGGFELIIVDDGSRDQTTEIIRSYRDKRITLINNPANAGPAAAANVGILAARGEYIARMDADDISLPYRFEKQMEVLDAQPEIGLVGSSIQMIDSAGNLLEKDVRRKEPGFLKWRLCFATSIAQPTIMARRRLLQEHKYDKRHTAAEDYNLWVRLSLITKMSNVEEILLLYRVHEENISRTKTQLQNRYSFIARQKMINSIFGAEVVPLSDEKMWSGVYEDTYKVAKLILKLYQVYVRDEQLTDVEDCLVRQDAARRLFNWARAHKDDPYMQKIVLRAIAMDPRLIGRVSTAAYRRLVSCFEADKVGKDAERRSKSNEIE